MWVKAFGLHLEPAMMARQIAWMRTSNGGWLAAVEMPATSGNGRFRLTMNLWLPGRGHTPRPLTLRIFWNPIALPRV
jgi:hypothetical protein